MGLLRTAARTAVITSTATRVHGRAAARQQGQWAAQQPPPPPPPAAAPAAPPPPPPPPPTEPVSTPPATSTMIDQLTRVGELRAAGVLTEAEFEAQKARILAGL